MIQISCILAMIAVTKQMGLALSHWLYTYSRKNYPNCHLNRIGGSVQDHHMYNIWNFGGFQFGGSPNSPPNVRYKRSLTMKIWEQCKVDPYLRSCHNQCACPHAQVHCVCVPTDCMPLTQFILQMVHISRLHANSPIFLTHRFFQDASVHIIVHVYLTAGHVISAQR